MLYYRTQKPKYVTLNQRKTKFAQQKSVQNPGRQNDHT